MVRQLTKIFTLITLFALTVLISTSTAQAESKLNELQYIKTYETTADGKSVFRIEIGLKRDTIDYSIKIPTSVSSMILIDLDNTIPGKLSRKKNNSIELSGAETVSINEVKINYTRLQFNLTTTIGNNSYRAYTLPANRKDKKPNRIVIDIDKTNPFNDFGNSQNDSDYQVGEGSIVIDAGHGGSDSGAVGYNGVTEKEVTLAVAKKVQRMLTESGAEVIMTRTTDRDVAWAGASNGEELQARVDKSPSNAALFISIHCNAFSNPSTHGMETYYYWGSAEGERLARLLNEELVNFGGLSNRGVKGANFYVLKHTSIPASLIELAFITNPVEENLLSDNDYQEQLALAITRAIKRYLGINPNGNFND